jgi:choline-sulfatase
MAIPLIVAAPDLPGGRICKTPASLLDIYPTILEGAGIAPPSDFTPPGQSLWHIARSPDDEQRIIFGEYHGASSPSGGFMLRKGRFKLIYYVGFPPELFDLQADPEELQDRSGDSAFAAIRAELEHELRRRVDPEAIDRRAKRDQRETIERNGGAEVLAERGVYQGTPVPGERPTYVH